MTFVSIISFIASGFLHHEFAESHATAEIDQKGKTGHAQSSFQQNYSGHSLSTGLLCIGYSSIVDQIVNLFEKRKICDGFGCSLNIAHKLFAVYRYVLYQTTV